MAESEAKVNMSLDDIIKMEKKKKANAKTKRGGGTTRGGTMRGGTRGARGAMRGTNRGGARNMRGSMRGRGNSPNKRGQWNNRYIHNNSLRGGFVKKRYNNGNIKTNLKRSRSNLSLHRMNLNNSSPRGSRGGFNSRRGGKFGLTRSRSRTNLSTFNNKPTFLAKNKGTFLKRTTSMPNLRDPSSVYNRLGYQSPVQIAYRNRVKRAKNVLLQRQSKAARMQSALMLTPKTKNMSPLERKQQMAAARGFNAGGLHSDQMMRVQRRAQYEQKLMRINSTHASSPVKMSFINSYANQRQHPAMALYPTAIQNQNAVIASPQKLQRGRSPFRQSLESLKSAARSASRSQSYSRQQQRRSRSRSRSRPRVARNNIALTGDLEDRSFSAVMYSFARKFNDTHRTLNDRFSSF